MTWLHAIPFPNISPIFFELGPLQFRWYGLMYLIGLACAYFLIKRRVESRGLAMTKDQVYNMVVWAAFGLFIGGRLGYTLFYNFSYYIQHPASIVAVWEGGMSFHGGLLGAIVALVWFSQRQGIPTYQVADLAAAVTPIGLGFGERQFHQWGVTWRSYRCRLVYGISNGGPACRHPSQLNEAGLEGVFLFTLVWVISKTTPPPGTLFWSFITGYGVCRMIVEFVREPDAHLGFILGSFSMGQLLSFPMIVVGVVMLAIGYQRRALMQAKS